MINAKLVDEVRNASVSVGTSATLVAEQLLYGQRKAIVLTNISTGGQVIYLSVGQQPSATGSGIPLYPAGSWSESLDSAFIPTNAQIWAISTAAAGTLAIHERLIKN